MKHYKAPDNSLHAIEPEYAYMLPAGSVEITDEEAESIRIANMPPPPPVDVEAMRLAAYRDESDPLFFKWQAGEATKEEWEAKRAEIKARWV